MQFDAFAIDCLFSQKNQFLTGLFFSRIITEHKLDSMNIYTHVARYLVQADRFMEVKTLAKCIRTSKETAAKLVMC